MITLQDTDNLEQAEMVVKAGAQLISAYRTELLSPDRHRRHPMGMDEVQALTQDFARLYWLKSLGLEEYEYGEGDE